MHEQGGRRLELVAKRAVGARGHVADRDDVAVADEHRGFAIDNLAALEMRRARDDEELIAVYVHLGQLIGLERVLDRERVEVVMGLEGAQLL